MAAPIHGVLVKRLNLCCYSSSVRKLLSFTVLDSARAASYATSSRRQPLIAEPESDADFRKFEIDRQTEDKKPLRRRRAPKRQYMYKLQPRYLKMSTDQDWTAVWPAAATFKAHVVPLPVRQGAIKVPSEGPGDGSSPTKFANLELLKIPNFLHLTPKHISKHCTAIKKFCTPWPEGLKTDEDCHKHFPLEIVSSDYCFSSPSIRDSRARTVTVKFKLADLGFDHHAKDKFLRLVGDRYNKETDEVTLISDRCPLKKQNYDYSMYLLTVLYFESWKFEPWEADKTVADMERYFWELSPSKENMVNLLKQYQEIDKASKDTADGTKLSYLPEEIKEDSIEDLEPVRKYKQSVEDIMNAGENHETLTDYKQSVLKMLNIKTSQTSS